MSAPGPEEAPEWYKRFQELNKGSSAPAEPPPAPRSSAGRGTERRRHPRFEVDDSHVTLYRDGLLTKVGFGKDNKARLVVDLSEGGLQVITCERLPIGSKVRIHLEIEKFQDAIELAGVVRWCFQNAQKKEDFYAGVQFMVTPPNESRKIAAMREYFTSAHYRAIRETRRRKRGDDLVFK